MKIEFFRTHDKLVEFIWPPLISHEILYTLIQASEYLESEYGEGIKEIRKGYHSISVRTHIEISDEDCMELVEEFKNLTTDQPSPLAKNWRLPVAYGGKFGKDLTSLAKSLKMSPEKVIETHSGAHYILHFYGFLPGFMYLGGLDTQLFSPRKEKPERLISAGSVAIGGQQTGIYPSDSPGGWHVVGKCPIAFFDIKKQPPISFQLGDCIQFYAIEEKEYEEIKNLSESGKYILKHD